MTNNPTQVACSEIESPELLKVRAVIQEIIAKGQVDQILDAALGTLAQSKKATEDKAIDGFGWSSQPFMRTPRPR